jgi:hypothetical protein
MAMDLALEPHRKAERRGQDEPDRKIELEGEIDHARSVAVPNGAHHGDKASSRPLEEAMRQRTGTELRHPVNRRFREEAHSAPGSPTA